VDLEAVVQELQPFLGSRTTSGFGDHGNTIYKLEFVDAAEPQWIVNGEDPRYGDAITLAQPMPPMLKRIKDLLFEQMQANGDMLRDTYNAEFVADNGELGFLQVSIPLEFGSELTLERLRAAAARGDVRETYGKHIDKPALFRGGANYIASLTICGSACITIWRGKEDWTYPMEALQWYAISKDIPHAVESGTDRIALVFRPKVLAAAPPASAVASTNRRESVARQDRRLEKKRVSLEAPAPAGSPQKRATKATAKRPASRSGTARRKR
jgi:hypothetical protein